jgi:hypothetical protein
MFVNQSAYGVAVTITEIEVRAFSVLRQYVDVTVTVYA